MRPMARLPDFNELAIHAKVIERARLRSALRLVPSVEGAPSESRRCAAPRIAGTRFRAPIFEQLHHVLAIELSRMRLLEVISDVGESEANAVPLRQRIDTIQIPNAAVGGERGHGAGGDRW